MTGSPEQQAALQHCRELITTLPESELFADNELCTTRIPTPRGELLRLLDSGSPDARDERGETLLHKVDSPTLIRALLAAGADPNALNHAGETPLNHAYLGKCSGILLDAGAEMDDTPLHVACEENDIARVHELLERGASPHVRGLNGQTPVCRTTSAEIVRLLVEAGADLDAEDVDGELPLQHANLELTRALLAHGADPNAQDACGQTALHHVRSIEKA